MTKEDIEKASEEYSEQDLERFKHDEYWEYLADELVCSAREDANIGAFIAGAEWMQEQDKYACVMETSNTENATDNDLIEECKRRGIFNRERNKLIKKAQQWAEDWFCNGEEWMRRTDFIEGVKEEIKQAMKGDYNE